MKYSKPVLKALSNVAGMFCEDGNSASESGCNTGPAVGELEACAYGSSAAGGYCYDGYSPSGWMCQLGGSPFEGAPGTRCSTGTGADDTLPSCWDGGAN